jgi:hypothetical protein
MLLFGAHRKGSGHVDISTTQLTVQGRNCFTISQVNNNGRNKNVCWGMITNSRQQKYSILTYFFIRIHKHKRLQNNLYCYRLQLRMKKVKQFHYVPWRRLGERYSSYSFLTSALDGVSGQSHAPSALYLRRKDPWYPWVGGWVGLRGDLDTRG